MIKILIAEDEALTRETLSTILGLINGLEVVAATGRGDEVAALIEKSGAAVAIVDIDMPGMTGIEVAEALHRDGRDFPVIILTSQGRPGNLQRGLKAGIRGFLTKDTSIDKLVEVITEVHGGGRYIDPELAVDALTAGENPLTPREIQILKRVEDARTLDEIGAELHLTAGTVRNHISSAIHKLGTRNKAGAVRRAREAGWI